MAAVGLAAQDRREESDHRGTADPSAFMVPAAVGTDFHRDVAGAFGVPLLDRRQRSEEHTSELQSLMRISYAVFCLKKKTEITPIMINHSNVRTFYHKI